MQRGNAPSGSMLGLRVDGTNWTGHINNRIAMAKNELRKLWRFRNLNRKTKRKLYLSLVRSTLTYPIIPLHNIPKTQKIKMQRVQNAATRYITNVRLVDRIQSRQLHRETKIEPLNAYMNRRSRNIWDKLDYELSEETKEKITIPERDRERYTYKKLTPSSKINAYREEPAIYS